jgi:hypothetical protein
MGVMILSTILLLAMAGAETPPEAVIARMEQWTAQQQRLLPSYQGRRRYFITHPLLDGETSALVEERFRTPEQKQFQVLERHGVRELENRVFSPLLEAELATAHDPQRAATEICRRNYSFRFLFHDAGPGAYVFEIEPRTSNPYLFRGKIWVDERDFAVRQIEGEPAQRPSVWVRSTHFVHEFAKFGNFWLPVRHRSEVDLLLFGRARMGIDYLGYQWEASQ